MITGRVNTKVFPEPVNAMPIISLPESLPEKWGRWRRGTSWNSSNLQGSARRRGASVTWEERLVRSPERAVGTTTLYSGMGQSTHIVGMPWICMGVGCWIPFFFKPLRIAVREKRTTHVHDLNYFSLFPLRKSSSSSTRDKHPSGQQPGKRWNPFQDPLLAYLLGTSFP